MYFTSFDYKRHAPYKNFTQNTEESPPEFHYLFPKGNYCLHANLSYYVQIKIY